MYDEVDLQLVNLLQIDPRIPWVHAEQLLGISATTLARRWTRLSNDGLAWIAVYPSFATEFATEFAAFVDVDCSADRLPAVIEQLCQNRMVVSVDETTGERDLLLTVIAPNLRMLTTLVLDEIGSTDGVRGSRSSLVTEIHVDGSTWRVNALDRSQTRGAAANLAPADPGRRVAAVDIDLVEALARDGRASVAFLAEFLNTPPSTVHRRLQRLLASHQVTMRCDVSPELSGWLVEWSWLVNIVLSDKLRLIEFLRSQPDLRLCASTAGANNFVFTFLSTAISGLADFEASVARTMPGFAPNETLIHLRARKRLGWILDAEGRATGRLVLPVFGS